MATLTTQLSGWGRYPVQTCELERPERYADLRSDAAQPDCARARDAATAMPR
jgi:hypothetical protein